ncbi:hypothetical protein [Pseudomonas sp. 1152_12]|uniref:hypothetical protein n=1 Tax=Pseudomonas sp. 1152_12 TaxID=2604455 RepID=UPI0040632CCF
MQFAVALIEYLISGVVASAWLTAVLINYYPLLLHTINDHKEMLILIYLPIAYILGIYVDTTSSYFIRRAKEVHRCFSKKVPIPPLMPNVLARIYSAVAGVPKSEPYKNTAAILAYSPADAVRTMEAYISRDRIARGTAFNSFAGAIVAFIYTPPEYNTLITTICLIAFGYSIIMHRRLSRLSSSFKEVVLNNLEKHTPLELHKRKAPVTDEK